jgi:hypothetical protein
MLQIVEAHDTQCPCDLAADRVHAAKNAESIDMPMFLCHSYPHPPNQLVKGYARLVGYQLISPIPPQVMGRPVTATQVQQYCGKPPGGHKLQRSTGRAARWGAYNELSALCLLLCHLLGLDGRGVLLAEGEIRDGDIVQDDVEVLRPFRQDPPDVLADDLHRTRHC